MSTTGALHFAEIQSAFCLSIERLEFFELNFESMIQVSLKIFEYHHTDNLKNLRMRKLQLLVTTYYLQIFWHDMKMKLAFWTIFDEWICKDYSMHFELMSYLRRRFSFHTPTLQAPKNFLSFAPREPLETPYKHQF